MGTIDARLGKSVHRLLVPFVREAAPLFFLHRVPLRALCPPALDVRDVVPATTFGVLVKLAPTRAGAFEQRT
ncbi:MAG: hypothetical protein K8T90_06960 [Planctomycetes bacterium]|nr:hypothetical protein [Planctomycetota bacterium]